MATSIGRADNNRKKRGGVEDGNDPDNAEGIGDGDDDGPPESQVLKKLKKKSRKVTLKSSANGYHCANCFNDVLY